MDTREKVLLVEDDISIIKNLTAFLNNEGYFVINASGQTEAIKLIEEVQGIDIALLDISLPDGNGYAICSYIKEYTKIPVIFLSASDDEHSVVAGLDMGADDYVSKPFRPRELLSRIKGVLRRQNKAHSSITVEDVSIDLIKGVVTKKADEIFLSALEYKLLLFFFNNQGIIISRTRLLEEIWDVAGDYVNDNTLTVYIKRLREKIEDNPQEPAIIKTVRGTGYRV